MSFSYILTIQLLNHLLVPSPLRHARFRHRPADTLVFRDALQMRLPRFEAAVPAISPGTFLLLSPTLLWLWTWGGGIIVALLALLGSGGGAFSHAPLFLLRQRRRRDQEVYAASLELGLRRQDQNPANNPLGTRFAQNMVWVCLQNLTSCDMACDLFYIAIQMDYADQVKSSTWKNTSQTTP